MKSRCHKKLICIRGYGVTKSIQYLKCLVFDSLMNAIKNPLPFENGFLYFLNESVYPILMLLGATCLTLGIITFNTPSSSFAVAFSVKRCSGSETSRFKSFAWNRPSASLPLVFLPDNLSWLPSRDRDKSDFFHPGVETQS